MKKRRTTPCCVPDAVTAMRKYLLHDILTTILDDQTLVTFADALALQVVHLVHGQWFTVNGFYACGLFVREGYIQAGCFASRTDDIGAEGIDAYASSCFLERTVGGTPAVNAIAAVG